MALFYPITIMTKQTMHFADFARELAPKSLEEWPRAQDFVEPMSSLSTGTFTWAQMSWLREKGERSTGPGHTDKESCQLWCPRVDRASRKKHVVGPLHMPFDSSVKPRSSTHFMR